jgi:FO synthase
VPAGARAYLQPDEILEIAKQGAAAGCTEALFTLGDRPEVRWPIAREELTLMGHKSTVSYLAAMAEQVLQQTGLLPHTNAGVLTTREMARLRSVSASQGLMIETLSPSVAAHRGCRTKQPALRLRQLEMAGRLRVPFTTGLLLGLGETRADTIDALLAVRRSHERWGHVQELIIQPFRPKESTRMAKEDALGEDDLLWACAAAKHLLGPSGVAIQSPPNLSADPCRLRRLLRCGVDDWGGVSPGVTPDHVNPEAAWPEVARLRACTEAEKLTLVPRLPAYPKYTSHRTLASRALARWQHTAVAPYVRRLSDGGGLARTELSADSSWHAGLVRTPPAGEAEPDHAWLPFGDGFEAMRLAAAADSAVHDPRVASPVAEALGRALRGDGLTLREMECLLAARGPDLAAVCVAADLMRQRRVGTGVSYVVCRNINYTNRCTYACTFCAFSKGSMQAKGAAYDVDHKEISRRSAEAWARGATEVCMQGGIDPRYDGASYVGHLKAALAGEPRVHVHAFSPLEVMQGAEADSVSTSDFLATLKEAGLGSLPGTSAEVLVDEVRREICPDKQSAAGWAQVVGEAHSAGLPTTATIMFGHTEGYASVARHLMRLRVLQERSLRAGHSAAITEFVPLPFVHPEAPLFRRGGARPGPTLREAVLLHAVARLALPNVPSIQTSWTKMGARGAAMALRAGANDLGGTLMSESISRAAGAAHGQEMSVAFMHGIVDELPPDAGGLGKRRAWQRTTLYAEAGAERAAAAEAAGPLQPVAVH